MALEMDDELRILHSAGISTIHTVESLSILMEISPRSLAALERNLLGAFKMRSFGSNH